MTTTTLSGRVNALPKFSLSAAVARVVGFFVAVAEIRADALQMAREAQKRHPYAAME